MSKHGHGRPAPPSVRRVVRRRLRHVLEALAGEPLTDAAVHEVRMEIKKARAAVRLLRHATGNRRYQRADRVLREATRPLGPVRDARVLLDALRQLQRQDAAGDRPAMHRAAARPVTGHSGAGRPAATPAVAGLPALQRTLRLEHRAARRRLLASRALEAHLHTLRQLLHRTRSWPDRTAWPRLAHGIEYSYRQGRRARDAMRSRHTAADLHAWRKQAKYLWYQLSLLGPAVSDVPAAQARALERLADALGDVHDLALLRALILHHPGRVPAATARSKLLRLIEERSDRLERRAMELGDAVYADKPRRYADRLMPPERG